MCSSKKPIFINEQEATALLSSLVMSTGLAKIPIYGSILF